jgi:hypothetical protein
MAEIITVGELGGLLELLHAHGYRLRKLSPGIIELADEATQGPPVPRQDFSDGRTEEADREEYERDKWAHVGGRPPWLRVPGQTAANPSADREGSS